MTLKDIIKQHTDRLNTLDPVKDHNPLLFNIGVMVLIFSFVLGFIYSWGIVLIGFLIYGILTYKSVKW